MPLFEIIKDYESDTVLPTDIKEILKALLKIAEVLQ